ncbi:hypothetical protein [Massilia sp. NP310]|uniref:hypothetical protein n=1 Tax=Massilia sp. NP310 TaxID=2861282 RepID=UPI001C63B7D3|nr:hypothetical protein [Massilia sp. NP310]QYG03989.1 hypothetical protein KY496_11725 [Massilia sp. NP310]
MKVEDILSHKAGNVFDKAGNGLSPADAEAIRRWNEDQITISNALNFQRQRAAAVPKSILDTPLKDVVEAWKSMQAQRARLSQLEAMLQSQDAAAGKKTGGRI